MGITNQEGYPRITIAGLSGDSGKSLVSLSLLVFMESAGQPAAAFKKGPDYIDAAWLSWACRRPARNLDTYLMGTSTATESFLSHGLSRGLNVIEGNRGLYDGADARGSHSTAELAKTLRAPVVLVVNAAKVTRTAAALVLGCQKLDTRVDLKGVVLNRVAGARHERILRDSIEQTCGVPVLGVIPKLTGDALLPQRHLGLLTPQEHPRIETLRERLLHIARENLDIEALLALASAVPPLSPVEAPRPKAARKNVTVGFLSDSAFSFYYPDNLEALECRGAKLLPLSPLSEDDFPRGMDALYIGGGFPETHGEALAKRRSWMRALASAARGGLPIYAECGGLMFLSRAIVWKGRRFPMAGVLPFDVEVLEAPQGHGYSELVVDSENPFFAPGAQLKGHEFHYSRIVPGSVQPPTACRVQRGTGPFPGRDGIVVYNTWASYTHLHALSTPEWASAVTSAARRLCRKKGGGRR